MTVGQSTAVRALDPGPRCRLTKALGEGSFGAVYRARLDGSEQEVAVKALTRVKPEALTRFKREFRALCQVNHPNLVGLRELFEHEGQWFIAMDLVEGTDLLSWVRSGARERGFDEARARKTFADVAQGLAALHAHGLLHRDLKPSNVRVTPDSKAVVLDFGLVTMADEEHQSTQRGGAGTLAYMAPEQMGGEKLTPAADLYAMGASLYQALTGRLPFEADSAFALMVRKANEEPKSPRHWVPQVPADLDALCMALLERSPRLRPSLESVLRVLLQTSLATLSLAPPRTSAWPDENGSFEGREPELLRLEKALARTHEGEISAVFIEGESGIGKSALVSEFVRRQLAAQPGTWVLAGRCYEHEHVPYKAFDACMDILAKYLAKLAPEVCRAVLPRRAGLLTELFPVLGGIRALAEDRALGAPAEPTARRLEAFAVLAELLGKLAESRPLILCIDDLQWADEESLRLLRHLLSERPPPVLVVSTVRPGRELSEPLRGALSALHKRAGAEWLVLQGLPVDTVEALATKLLGVEAGAGAIQRIAYESYGHPMLMAELCHYARTYGGAAQSLSLDAALAARIGTLTAGARHLLELLALCGRPLREGLFQTLGTLAFEDAVKELLAQRFARRGLGQVLAVAHDRVRAATLTLLGSERTRRLHAQLAQALEDSQQGEPSERGEHWERAGEKSRAAQCYVEAAKLALAALAFGSAAEHFERAFRLLGEDTSRQRGALLTQYGQALAGAGQSAAAAIAFTQAAERLEGDERVQLRVLAAQHQLQSAQLSEGVRETRAVLAEVGISLPHGVFRSVLRILFEQARLALRLYRVRLRAAEAATAKRALNAIDSLLFPLSWADFPAGAVLNPVRLRMAMGSGEPGHLAQALAHEAVMRVLQERDGVEALLAQSEELSSRSDDPVTQAFVFFERGVAAILMGAPAAARTHCEAAEAILTSSCPGEGWRLVNARMMLACALFQSGEHARLRAGSSRWLSEASERGDAFAYAALLGLGFGFVSMLMDDAPEQALAAIV